MSGAWIQTASGRRFDFVGTRHNQIHIDDICWALSHQIRYAGHCAWPYSVAQHSCHVSDCFSDPYLAYVGLMHDAVEAYIGDMPTPLKRLIPTFSALEQEIWEVLAMKFYLPMKIPSEIKEIDLRILKNEREVLLGTSPESWSQIVEDALPIEGLVIEQWDAGHARENFMKRFIALCPSKILLRNSLHQSPD